MFEPTRVAARWYFGELMHEDLPAIAIEALEHGYDGPMLRRLAGLTRPTSRDIRVEEIDGAFREMGIAAPSPDARSATTLAVETARAVASGLQNPFDAAAHIRIGICRFKAEPPELERIVRLSEKAEHAPRLLWSKLERDIRDALSDFLVSRQ
jgi:hypothetical protein